MILKLKLSSLLKIGIILSILVLACSKKESPTEPKSDETLIIDLFKTLENAYNIGDQAKAQSCFSASYLHQGISDIFQVEFLEGFGSEYTNLELSNITPVITGETATCSFHTKLTYTFPNDSGTEEGNFPQDEDLGVHILKKESSGWKIFGNQISSYMNFIKNGTQINWTVSKFWKSSSTVEVYSGPSQQDDEDFEFRLKLSEGNLPLGTYTQNDRVESIHYYEYDNIENVSITISKFDLTNRVIEGTFSATLKNAASQTVQLTNGSFQAVD
ncbi:MAG: hypothetical protein K8R73_02900 [Clostridiales bacterium]|nr:hypothetical protein [Clostridiales bacterium]